MVPLPLSELCDALMAASAERAVRCGLLATAQVDLYKTVSRTTCEDYKRRAGAGSRVYDGAVGRICVDKLKNLECTASSPPECSTTTLFTAGGPSGSTCTSDSDCKDTYCAYLSGGNCQSCRNYVGLGQRCWPYHTNDDLRCSSDLTCFREDGGFNDYGRCETYRRLPGEVCSSTLTCSSDAGYCSLADAGVRVCEAYRQLGQACDTTARCLYPYWCGNADAGVRLCEDRRAVGQECSTSSQCDTTAAYCPSTPADGGLRLCTPLKPDGEPCSLSTECFAPTCRSTPDAGRLCGYAPTGSECTSSTECGSTTSYCRGYLPSRTDAGLVRGTCQPKVQDGGACQIEYVTITNNGCANSQASCIGGSCVEVAPYSLPLGSDCDDQPGQCVDTAYCSEGPIPTEPRLSKGSCVARKAEGGACPSSSDEECEQGLGCDYNDDTCKRLGRTGEVCNLAVGCMSVNSCVYRADGGVDGGAIRLCLAYSLTGGPCGTGNPSCYDSYCDTASSTCVAKLANGAQCATSTNCQSARCYIPDGGDPDAGRFCQPSCWP